MANDVPSTRPGPAEPSVQAVAARQLDWCGMRIPTRFGGHGVSNRERVRILAGVAEGAPAVAAILQAVVLGAAPVVYCGTEAQQRRWLPGWARGETWPSLAVTEPGSGGNVLAMATTAHRVDGGWKLAGRKCFVGNSDHADVHVVIARTGTGSGGLSAFVVEAHREGVHLGRRGDLAGLAGFTCGEVILDGVWVPEANIVGAEGDGLAAAYAVSILDGRLNIAAVAVGIAAAAARHAAAQAATRTIDGRPLSSFPTTLARLGAIRSHYLTARQVTDGAARMLDAGMPCDEELVNAKHVAVAAARDAVSAATEVFAAAGCTPTARVHRLALDVQPLLFAAGTPDVQLRRLGESATGRWHPGRQWSHRMRDRLAAIHPPSRTDGPGGALRPAPATAHPLTGAGGPGRSPEEPPEVEA